MLKIACVGIAVQDRLYYVEQLPNQGGKFIAQNYREVGGGPAATAAVAAARLGAKVDFIGRVGDDTIGKVIIAELQQEGVNTRFTKVCTNARSSQSAIMVDQQGERMIVTYPSPDLTVEAEWIKLIDFQYYDAVLADVRWHEGALQAFVCAKEAGKPTVLDGDITPQDIRELVRLSDYAAFSESGIRHATNMSDLSQALKCAKTFTTGTVLVTQGKSGSMWLEHGELRCQPAFPVKVVDTTGAGDVFHGALVLAIAEGHAFADAVRFASGVAALKCTQPGGRAGIPNRAQIGMFLSNAV